MLHLNISNTANSLKNTVELDNQVDKLAICLGDLKSFQTEAKFKELESQIRTHNINSIDEGITTHFRTLREEAHMDTLWKPTHPHRS